MFWQTKLKFPARKNNSLEDDLKRQAQRSSFADMGEFTTYASWDDIFKRRSFDSSFYTALNNRACILVYFSTNAIPHQGIIDEVLSLQRPWLLHVAAFVKGPLPFFRCHLAFPDNPQDPYFIESPLDIQDGNVQDFCQAILSDEHIDIILKHQLWEDGHYSLAYHGSGIASVLKKELQQVLKKFNARATEADFTTSVKMMEKAFPSNTDGIDRAKIIPLRLVGQAQNSFINKSF